MNRTTSNDFVIRLTLLFACVLTLTACLSVQAFGQEVTRPDHSVPAPLDWSSKHVLFPAGFTPEQAERMRHEPRAYVQWLRYGYGPTDFRLLRRPPIRPRRANEKMGRDWAVSLGAGGVAAGMSPAKYSFDVTAAPNCSSDFAVFPIDASTGNTRAHVVGTFHGAASTGTTSITITPAVGTPATLTLTASTTLNTGLDFKTGTSRDTDATNLAAAINRNLSNTALDRIVALAATDTVTVYALTPGSRVTLTDASTLTNFAWGAVTAGTNGTQASIVAFNQLYSGSAPSLCGFTEPKFIFSYASGVGPIATSPNISLSGTEISYVENDPNIGAILHVLTFGSGNTEYGGGCANSNNGTAMPTCATDPVIPGSTANSTATDFMLPLGLVAANATTAVAGAADSFSSPFIDYLTDTTFVGDNNGFLYSITPTFNGTPAYAGGNFPVTVDAGADLSAPVVDVSGTGNIFVGDSNANLYEFTSAGATAAASLALGETMNGGIRDAPIVDSTNSVGYVVTACTEGTTGGEDDTTNSALTQFSFTSNTLTKGPVAGLDSGANEACMATPFPMYDPTPDARYFDLGITSATAADNGEIITGSSGTGGQQLKAFQFVSSVLQTTPEGNDKPQLGDGASVLSPLTEFFNSQDFSVTGITATTTTVTVTAANTLVANDMVTLTGVTADAATGCTAADVTAINGGLQTVVTATATQFTFSPTATITATTGCTTTGATATGGPDYMFLGVEQNPTELYSFLLPSGILVPGAASANPPIVQASNTADVAGGTSAIIIDNDSTDGQASSLYFGTLAESTTICGGTAAYCAVKVTQAALQ
jgi:hypothetical protein